MIRACGNAQKTVPLYLDACMQTVPKRICDYRVSLRRNNIIVQQEINDVAVKDAFLIGDHAGNIGLNDDALEEIVGETERIHFRDFFFPSGICHADWIENKRPLRRNFSIK